MNRVAYILAATIFAALLLVISPLGSMAAQPSQEMGTSMGPPQGSGGSFQGGPPPGAGERRTYGSDQSPSTGEMDYGQPAQTGGPEQQGSKGGEAVVIGVDQPDNCLRIRKGPSSQYEQVGCAKLGAKLRLTGVFSNDNRWAQLDDNSWVFACQIKTDVKPPSGSIACGRPGGGVSYETWSEPASHYGDEDFGSTYDYGGGPLWFSHRFRHHHFHHGGHHGGHQGGHHGGHHGGHRR